MKYIVLNKEQANKVRGLYGKYSALDPIEIKNSLFILPIDVLKNSEFKKVHEFLKTCEIRKVEEEEFIEQGIQQ